MLAMRRLVPFVAALFFALSASLAHSQTVIATVPVGANPQAVAVNQTTNKIYVANSNGNTVTVIDGITNSPTATVAVGTDPFAIAVNPATNKIYVANFQSNNVTVIDGATNNTTPVNTGTVPDAVAVNSVTNKIYVANETSNTVTVIDGATNSTLTVQVGNSPIAIAVNPVTNKIYTANNLDGTVTVIDGATNVPTSININGSGSSALAINTVTNKIYVTNSLSNNVTVIDGATNHIVNVGVAGGEPVPVAVNQVTNQIYVGEDGSPDMTVIDGATNHTTKIVTPAGISSIAVDAVTNKIYATNNGAPQVTMVDGTSNGTAQIPVGNGPGAIAANSVTNRVYVANSQDNTVSVIAGASSNPLRFVAIPPCRAVDTRPQHGGNGPIFGNTSQNFPISGTCGIPSTAAAYSTNVTVIPHGALGYLTVWPTGLSQPLVSTLNSVDGRVKADAAILPAGASGDITVFVNMATTASTDVVVDVNGYFVPASGLQFYPLPPCRVVDTRGVTGPLGGPNMTANQTRDFPLLSSTKCPIPSTAQAYSVNFTVVPTKTLGYLTAWPADQAQPTVSTLNDTTGTIVANAAIVPAAQTSGSDYAVGDIKVFVTDATALLIDINGYFAPPGTNGESLYTAAPCRVLDTRKGNGAFNGLLVPPLNVIAGPCGIPFNAGAFVFNATVVPQGPLGYLTLWPDGLTQPVVSTLNAFDGAITNNMAVVPSQDGSIDAYANGTTNLLLDISSYFAPTTTGALSIFPDLPIGVMSTPYFGGIAATGGSGVYTWSITQGSLPPGLNLTQNQGFALIQGTPTTAGAFNFTAQVQDTQQNTATANLTIAINSNQTFSMKTQQLPVGSVGAAYSAPALLSQGGTGPFVWSVATGSGMFPPGLTLNANGTITGSPTTAGTYTFFVQVKDNGNAGALAFGQFYIIVNSGAGNGQISGNYAFSINLFDGSGQPSFVVGSFVADGKGNIASGVIDINSQSSLQTGLPLTGSYSINANGVGALSLTMGNDSADFAIAVSTTGDIRIIQFLRADLSGGSGSGIINKQNPANFSLASISGPFAFGLSGIDIGNNRFGAAGQLQFNSSGQITQGAARCQ